MITHTPSYDLGALRNQFRMTHTFNLVLGTDEPIAGPVEATLKSAKARIEKWVITRRGGCYEHCIIVAGIGDETARELRKELARLDGEIKVHVEHMLHFGNEAAHR
jgi:hypothetical protein